MMTVELPTKPIVVYDGECAFCVRQIGRIRRMDAAAHFDYVPRQEPTLEKRFPILAESDFNTGIRLIGTDGSVTVGADAMYEVMRRLPRLRLVAWLYRVPGIHGLCRALYAWIAANRQRLSRYCDTGACDTPAVSRRDRSEN